MLTVQMNAEQMERGNHPVEGAYCCWRGVDLSEDVGGVVLTYSAKETTSVRVVLDDSSNAAAASFMVPAASMNQQLFQAKLPAGQHDIYLYAAGVHVEAACFYSADLVSVGVNPVITVDMPDPDVIRVGDTYYMASTTMVNMPGGTLLRSYDLIHWEIAAYLFDHLPDTEARSLQNGKHAYGQGMWAPTLRYHKGTFHVCFSANDTHCTYHYWSQQIEGPWQMQQIGGFYHDCSLFFDDDDRVYMVYGNNRVWITELDAAFSGPKEGGLHRLLIEYGESRMLGYEGSHLYKHEGRYYLFTIHSNRDGWYREESCFRADRLTDEFTGGVILHDDMGYHDQGVAQGGMVDTPDGRWYAFLFQDRGASGRMPVLMPMHWENGMPVLGMDGHAEPVVCNLTTRPGYEYAPISCSDDFVDTQLSAAWQWNHRPLERYVQVGQGSLRLINPDTAASVLSARNVLTMRAVSPVCIAEVTVEAAAMHDGDLAGLCAFQSGYAWIGIARNHGGYSIVIHERKAKDTEVGTETVRIPWQNSCATFRMVLDFQNMRDQGALYVQTADGWKCLLSGHPMAFTLDHFIGHKVALFSMATKNAGGMAVFSAFRLQTQET